MPRRPKTRRGKHKSAVGARLAYLLDQGEAGRVRIYLNTLDAVGSLYPEYLWGKRNEPVSRGRMTLTMSTKEEKEDTMTCNKRETIHHQSKARQEAGGAGRRNRAVRAETASSKLRSLSSFEQRLQLRTANCQLPTASCWLLFTLQSSLWTEVSITTCLYSLSLSPSLFHIFSSYSLLAPSALPHPSPSSSFASSSLC